MEHLFRSDLQSLFGSAVQSREDTSRRSRRTGCETVSVTDSLRLPDRLAQRASSQNDLSIVHTEKKSDKSSSSDVTSVSTRSRISVLERHRKHRCLKLVFLLLRRVLSIHPVSFPARYIGCINIGTLCIAFAWTECPFLSFRPSSHVLKKRILLSDCNHVDRTRIGHSRVTWKFEDVIIRRRENEKHLATVLLLRITWS